eukprot:EG_transcript_10047
MSLTPPPGCSVNKLWRNGASDPPGVAGPPCLDRLCQTAMHGTPEMTSLIEDDVWSFIQCFFFPRRNPGKQVMTNVIPELTIPEPTISLRTWIFLAPGLHPCSPRFPFPPVCPPTT